MISLDGNMVVAGTVALPRVGAWRGSLQLPEGAEVSGAVTLDLDGRTMVCAVLRSATFGGRVSVDVEAGAGGLGLVLPRRGYSSSGGVRLSTVVGDLVRESGEAIRLPAAGDRRLGEQWARAAGTVASSLWELSASWWVADDGAVELGARPAAAASAYTVEEYDEGAGIVRVTGEAVGLLSPGQSVDIEGATRVIDSVEHQIVGGADTALLGLARADGGEGRLLRAMEALVAKTSRAKWAGSYRYRVVAAAGNGLDLEPASSGLALPALARVPVRASAGIRSLPTSGAIVVVQFADLDPGQPYVVACESGGGTFEATGTLEIDAAAIDMGASVGTLDVPPLGHVVRYGDPVSVGASAGVMTFTGVAPIVPSVVRA